VSTIHLHPEHRAGEGFYDLAFDLDLVFALGQSLSRKNRAA
jgi:hypothetical protein